MTGTVGSAARQISLYFNYQSVWYDRPSLPKGEEVLQLKSGPSVQSGRAFTISLVVLALFGTGLVGATAQSGRSRRTYSAAPPVTRFERPLSNTPISELPLQRISREEAREFEARAARVRSGFSTAAATPPATQAQFFDLTTNPRPPQVGTSSGAQEIHPNWAWDQQSIFFSSNNTDPVGNYGANTPPSNALFHIYRMTSDGNLIQQVTGLAAPETGGNQFYPAVNHALTKLAYVHRDNPTQPYQLYILDLATRQRTQMTGVNVLNNPINLNLVNIEKPSWSPNDTSITFAARDKRVAGDVRNVYIVDLVSKVVTKLTEGTPTNGVECIDPVYYTVTNDARYPGSQSPRIAFAANAPSVSATTGRLVYTANPLRNLDGGAVANDIDHNLFHMPEAAASLGNPMGQITSSIADDVEPAYNSSLYPPQPGNPTPTGAFHGWIAFASKGRPTGVASRPLGTTYDIYFLNFPSADGSETASNTAIRLFTPDTNAGAVPLDQTDERYPTWSSGQPPQKPIDRIAFSSNRKNNLDDVSRPLVGAPGETDIWSAEVTDITPPTLFSFDEQKGEVLHIANAALPNQGRRIGVPGDTFYFYARLADLQYGIESVWLQIKDPDGPSTDAQGQNHRLYGEGTFPSTWGTNSANNQYGVRWVNNSNQLTHVLHIPWETDFEGIGVSDYAYYASPVEFDPAAGSRGRFPSYNPGVDDSVSWSGIDLNPFGVSQRPPLDSGGNPRWLRLRDDGVTPDLVAADGIFSAQWVTPNEGSDFIVDLIAYDKAFDPQDPNRQQNWIIYDNIWGFSTQSFVSQNPVLYVDDNGAGQKWARGLKGNFRPFPEFRYGTESDILDRPSQYLPREVSRTGNLTNINAPDGDAPDFTTETFHFLDNSPTSTDFISWSAPGRPGTLRRYRYDIWRILAKGPLPETVFNDYVPVKDEQPLNVTGSQTVQRPVPRRAIVWSSPYTGDNFMGAGSILDQATQEQLTNYRNRAGRLVVAGGDILWALTVNGTVQQTFAQNVLGANFVADEGGSNFNAFVTSPIATAITHDVVGGQFSINNGTPPYWNPFVDPAPLGTAFSPAAIAPGNPRQGDGNVDWTAATDGTPFRTQDNMTPRPGWTEVFSDRMIVNDDTGSLTATQSKSVFMSFSLASMGRRYVAESDTLPLDCMNYRAKISHAMFCWMFSADLTGQVTNLNGGAPISGAWVQAYVGNNLVGAAFSRGDGTYTIRGLPVGAWNIQVDNPGFQSFNKATGSGAHGLSLSQLDVLLTPAAPGSISGRVTDAFDQPVPGARIKATIQASPLFTGQRDYFAETLADGTYLIPSAPVGSYDVVVETPLPAGFTNATALFTPPVVVNPAQNTPNINFRLDGGAGALQVSVREQLSDGTRGGPVAAADVTLLTPAGTIIGTSLVTDAQGLANFTAVPAGPTTVSVFKPGFQEGSATVSIPQQTTVEILIPRAAVRALYGSVVRQIDGQVLSGSDLNVPIDLQLLRRVSQLPIGASATVFAPPLNTPTRHNYVFTNGQDGQFTVALRGHTRFLDATVNVDITSVLPNVAPLMQVIGRPGTLTGTAREQQGAAAGPPVVDATVTLTSEVLNPGNVAGSVQTGADGVFTFGSTTALPSDVYTLTISKFGHSTRTVTGVFLAGDTNVGDILLTRAPRGQIYGLVGRNQTPTQPLRVDVPRDGVKIEFFTASNSPFGSQKVTEVFSFLVPTGAPDGGTFNYQAGDAALAAEFLPEGDYDIRIVDTRFSPVNRRITVTGNQQRRVDIVLQPLSGTLGGVVREDLGNGVAGQPVAGAQVRILLNGAQQGATLTTDAQGNYRTTQTLSPNTYTISAQAFGFFSNTQTTFVEGNTTAPELLLRRLPPTSVSGSVQSGLDNKLIAGATVELLPSNGQGPALVTTVSDASTTAPNYTLGSVSPGTYLIRASKSGWKTSPLRSLTVNPGSDTTGINLTLQPDYVFGKGLLLISLPDDYPGLDVAGLFDQQRATFKSAYWLTPSLTYAVYPAPEASEMRLGKGMFVRFNTATAFTKTGTPAPNSAYSIPVRAGWNLIGSVRRTRIEWLRVKVATPDGNVRTMQQAMDAGIVQNGLFGFVDRYTRSDYMDPFSGYFMRAFQDCTLVVPVNNNIGSITPEVRKKVARHAIPSLEQVAKELNAAGLGVESREIPRLGTRQPAVNNNRLGWFSRSPLGWLLGQAADLLSWRPNFG